MKTNSPFILSSSVVNYPLLGFTHPQVFLQIGLVESCFVLWSSSLWLYLLKAHHTTHFWWASLWSHLSQLNRLFDFPTNKQLSSFTSFFDFFFHYILKITDLKSVILFSWTSLQIHDGTCCGKNSPNESGWLFCLHWRFSGEFIFNFFSTSSCLKWYQRARSAIWQQLR